jgi:hypothetical protein
MMHQMGNMMQMMSGMMAEGMSPANMMKMSEIVKDMSRQMMDMSNMIRSGSVSKENMEMLQRKMTETNKSLEMMK